MLKTDRSDPRVGIIFENWQNYPWKTAEPAPLEDRYPPGYQYSDKWPIYGMNSSAFLSPTRWQSGPHYYNLQKNVTTPFKPPTDLNTDGYSHKLHLDLSVHVWRHYKLIIVPGGYTVVFPDLVD
jgi:hypothetical protein